MLHKWASSRVRCCHNWSGTTGVLDVCARLYVCTCRSMCANVYQQVNTQTHTQTLLPMRQSSPKHDKSRQSRLINA